MQERYAMLPPGLEAIRQQLQTTGRHPLSSTAEALLRELEFLEQNPLIQRELKRAPTLPPGPTGGSGNRCVLCGCDPATCP
jgi:hypothetical protein